MYYYYNYLTSLKLLKSQFWSPYSRFAKWASSLNQVFFFVLLLLLIVKQVVNKMKNVYENKWVLLTKKLNIHSQPKRAEVA